MKTCTTRFILRLGWELWYHNPAMSPVANRAVLAEALFATFFLITSIFKVTSEQYVHNGKCEPFQDTPVL